MPDRQLTESLKWQVYDRDVLPLWVADMDFLSPPAVIEALHQRIDHGVFGYTLPIPELLDAIVERLDRLYGWKITHEDVIFIPGVVAGFNLACHAIADPGDSMIIQPPVYPPFLQAGSNAGLTRLDSTLIRDRNGSYSIDFDAFQSVITPDTRIFLLCNPHNPVGRVFRPEELEKMAEICLKHKITIISDEIHCDLIYSDHRHTPIATLNPEVAQNTITLVAPSKTFNIAGLDFSIGIVQNPDLRKKIKKARGGMVPSVNLLGQTAALAAYRYGQEWLDELLVYLESNRDFVYQYVNRNLPGIKMVRPEGTFLAWLDCRETRIAGNPYKFFLDKARVALGDGQTYGPGGDGFVRLNFGCPRAFLSKALDQMKSALVR